MAQTLGSEFSGGITGQAEGFGDRRAEKRVAKRVQDQRQRAFGDVVIFVPDGQLRDQVADRIEDWIKSVAIAREDHPGRKRARALPAECVEALIDDYASIGFASPRPLDRLGDAGRHRIGDRLRQLALEAGGRAEMMEEVGVRAPDPRRYGL